MNVCGACKTKTWQLEDIAQAKLMQAQHQKSRQTSSKVEFKDIYQFKK